MRHYRLSLIVSPLVFLAFLAGTLLIARSAGRREASSVLDASRKSFAAMIEVVANGISTGYFRSDALYGSVRDGKLGPFEKSTGDIRRFFPEITAIELKNLPAPRNGFYAVSARGTDTVIDFALCDSSGIRRLSDRVVRVTVNSRTVLASISSGESCRFVTPLSADSLPFAYGLYVRFTRPFISPYGAAISLVESLLVAFMVFFAIRSRESYFYNTEGLDRIVFLYEQTERYSANHSRNVARICEQIGIRIGLRGKRLRDLYVAALLHDIGKVSIPLEILTKPGRLTPAEYAQIKRHPEFSANTLNHFRELAHLVPFVLYHHERMDGSGYPAGLSGYDIPLESRIIAVADVFEALIGERPYRSPSTVPEALAIMRTQSLDPDIVDILEALIPTLDRSRVLQQPRGVRMSPAKAEV